MEKIDLSLAKSLANHGSIVSFEVYHFDRIDWFFHVKTNICKSDSLGEPFCTARGSVKHYKTVDALMREIFAINDADEARRSIPILVHYS